MGGLHHRKKRTVATIYGFGGLRSIEDHQALLETVAVETLALENSVARNRAVNAIVATGVKLLAIGEFEERLEALEAAQRRDQEVGPSGSLGGDLLDGPDL